MYRKASNTRFLCLSSGTVETPATLTGSSLKWPWSSLPPTSYSSWTWTRTSSWASPTPTRNTPHPLRVKQAYVLKTAGHVSLSACMYVSCTLRVVKAHSYYCNRIYQRAQVDHHISKGTMSTQRARSFPSSWGIAFRVGVYTTVNAAFATNEEQTQQTPSEQFEEQQCRLQLFICSSLFFPRFGLYLSELYTELMFNSLA